MAGKYHEAVLELYYAAGREAHRVLRERGVAIVKCQDEVCANRQRFTHIEILGEYQKIGLVAEDLFVVMRNNRPGSQPVGAANPCAEKSFLLSGVLETGQQRGDMEPGIDAVEAAAGGDNSCHCANSGHRQSGNCIIGFRRRPEYKTEEEIMNPELIAIITLGVGAGGVAAGRPRFPVCHPSAVGEA